MRIEKFLLAAALALSASGAWAQTVKIGFITSYTGLKGNLGPYKERAVRLYMPWSCGIETWDSSITSKKSSGK